MPPIPAVRVSPHGPARTGGTPNGASASRCVPACTALSLANSLCMRTVQLGQACKPNVFHTRLWQDVTVFNHLGRR
jgi:hypothetical protein